MRDIDIRKDVYVHVVLSSGTTLSLLDACHLDDQVDRELTIDGVNSAHCTEDFVFSNLVCISYWHVKLDGLKFNVASVESYLTPSLSLAQVLSTHHGCEVYGCSLSLSIAVVWVFCNM